MFDEVDEALGQKLSELMFDGPLETLTLTENAQPALMAVSLAVMRVLEQRRASSSPTRSSMWPAIRSANIPRSPPPARSRVADAARLLKTRGQAMQAAVPVGQGAMAALLGVGKDVAEKLAAEAAQGEVCQLANDNEPTQAVISGAKSAIDRAAQLAKAHGVRRFMPLNVSAPFHCALMQPAADAMAEALAKVDVKAPAVPLIANVLAAPISDPAEIKQRLVEQVTGTVRWRECVAAMAAEGVTDIYEIGSGKVLAGLAKRIVPTLNATADRHAAGHRCRAVRARTIEDIMFELTDKTALVTGATGGIGGAIARALHKQGATVAISGRQTDKLEQLAAELGSRVHVLPLRSCRQGAGSQADRRGHRQARPARHPGQQRRPHQGQSVHGDEGRPVGRRDRRQPHLDLHADARGGAGHDARQDRLRPHHQHLLRQRHHRQPGQGNYAASKAGMIGMSKSLAREVASRGITVNCIAPGFISTPMTDALNEKQVATIKEAIPAQKFGTPADIAAACVYLAAPEAGYMTGQTLHVNGGMVMI